MNFKYTKSGKMSIRTYLKVKRFFLKRTVDIFTVKRSYAWIKDGHGPEMGKYRREKP